MYDRYFQDEEIRPEFEKEFVSIFDGWLGEKNYHRLDEVTDPEWERFNDLLRRLHRTYRLHIVDLEAGTSAELPSIERVLTSHDEAGNKQSSEFTRILIPDLDAAYTEEWDYTWILWHRRNGAVEALSPLIKSAGLFHWH